MILLACTAYSADKKSSGEDYFSQRLSNSFQTVPVGRTNIGVRTVPETKTGEFEREEERRQYACAQDKQKCAQETHDDVERQRNQKPYKPKINVLEM